MRWESLRMLQHIRIATSAFALQCIIYTKCDLYAWNAMFFSFNFISLLLFWFQQTIFKPTDVVWCVAGMCVCVRVSFSKILCKFCLVLTLTQITEIALIFSLNVYALKKSQKIKKSTFFNGMIALLIQTFPLKWNTNMKFFCPHNKWLFCSFGTYASTGRIYSSFFIIIIISKVISFSCLFLYTSREYLYGNLHTKSMSTIFHWYDWHVAHYSRIYYLHAAITKGKHYHAMPLCFWLRNTSKASLEKCKMNK